MQNRLIYLILLAICFILSSCATHKKMLSDVDTTNLSQLEQIRTAPLNAKEKKVFMGAIRANAIKDIALRVGAQGGLAFASEKMNKQMEKDRKYLDSIYNFNGMMLTHGVIPPVLVEGDNSLNLEDPSTIRVADRTYKIEKQARFATTPPNWREYLLLSFAKPSLPDKTLLPRDAEEQAVWKKGIQMGWEKGIQQAYSIFQQNLARLKRDYQGMILYRKLLQYKMISPPFVARTELGVTGTGGEMRVNDQVLRIVELPQLQPNSKHWNAIVVKR